MEGRGRERWREREREEERGRKRKLFGASSPKGTNSIMRKSLS